MKPKLEIVDDSYIESMSAAGHVETMDGLYLSSISKGIVEARILQYDQSNTQENENISIDDLYPLRNTISRDLSTALNLLDECIALLRDAMPMTDAIEIDTNVMRVQQIIPELNCCRSIGDGFGLIILSLFHSFQNNEGIPLKHEQMAVILKAISRLRSEPYISFTEASKMVMELEDMNLQVGPPHLDELGEFLDD